MIDLGCHSRNYGGESPEDRFRFISKLGFKFIDVDSVSTIRQADAILNPEKTALCARTLSERFGLALDEYFMGTVWTDGAMVGPSEPDMRKRERMYDSFGKICKFAGLAGFRSIMGSAGTLHPGLELARSLEHTAESLREMVRIAGECGVAFHVEPSRNSLLNAPSAALEMAEAVPGLKFTLDFLHFQVNGHDQEETMKLLPYTGHMHARQAAVGWIKCPFEHGEIDFDRIIKRLRGLRWRGGIAMEFWNGAEEEAAGICPVEQTIVMRYHLKGLIKRYY